MNCREFQDILQDLARYQGMDVATLKAALEHAEGCPVCDDLLIEADALSADLRLLAERDARRHAPASIETALLAALAERHASARERTRRRLAAAGVLGIAAAALFAISLSRRIRPAAGGDSSAPPLAVAVGISATSAKTSPPGEILTADAQRTDVRPDTSDDLSVFDDGDGDASFVPLTETFDAASLDGDAVLRVSLSAADLARFGLSPSQTGGASGQPVLADLVVSSDGVPQAIRLLPR